MCPHPVVGAGSPKAGLDFIGDADAAGLAHGLGMIGWEDGHGLEFESVAVRWKRDAVGSLVELQRPRMLAQHRFHSPNETPHRSGSLRSLLKI